MQARQFGRGAVVIGLAIHFVAWSALNTALWARGFGWYSAFWHAVAAPAYLGAVHLQPRWDHVLGVLGLGATVALAASLFCAIRYRRRWIVMVAHAAIVLYWLASFLLIAEGV